MMCTHIVFHVKDIDATRLFYVERLGCMLHHFSSEEKFLSIAVGNFVINFYGFQSDAPENYSLLHI
jgi:extradiol dioxygenase family protein